jgi:hypothetical protein
MSPAAINSALALAQKMRWESGVDAAVDSFYRWLPLDQMECQILSHHPARWSLKAGRRKLRLSNEAVVVLIGEKKIKLEELNS